MLQLYIVYRVFLYRKDWKWIVGAIVVCWLMQIFLDPEGETLNRVRYNFMGGMLPFGLGLLYAKYGRDLAYEHYALVAGFSLLLIIFCILGIAYTGGLFAGESLIDAFANADSVRGLVMGSLIAVLLTLWLYLSRGVMGFKDFMGAFAAGFRSMCAPMIILILSWNLSGMTGLLGAAEYIHKVVESSAGGLQMFVPFLVFVVSVFLAFSTGTSWGTFTILIPIVCAIFPADSEMLVISIAACLSGAVCGDHCSPISDTTIMSSAGAHCDHINHVTTQMPYALTAAAVSAVGYLAAGVIGYRAESALALVSLPLTLLLMAATILVIRRRVRDLP